MPKERKSWLLISWIMTSLSRFFTLIFRNMSRLPLSGQKAEFDTIQWGDHFSSATILASGNTAHTTNERPVSRSRDDSRPMRVATHRTLAWWRDQGHYTGATNCNLLQMQITQFDQNMQRQCPLWRVAGPQWQWPDTEHLSLSAISASEIWHWLLIVINSFCNIWRQSPILAVTSGVQSHVNHWPPAGLRSVSYHNCPPWLIITSTELSSKLLYTFIIQMANIHQQQNIKIVKMK